MTPLEKLTRIKQHLNDTGMYVFINILYPALKKDMNIDYTDVCRLYPEYEERVISDKSKRTRLSKAKSIIKNGWEKEALSVASESERLDPLSKKKALDFLNAI